MSNGTALRGPAGVRWNSGTLRRSWAAPGAGGATRLPARGLAGDAADPAVACATPGGVSTRNEATVAADRRATPVLLTHRSQDRPLSRPLPWPRASRPTRMVDPPVSSTTPAKLSRPKGRFDTTNPIPAWSRREYGLQLSAPLGCRRYPSPSESDSQASSRDGYPIRILGGPDQRC